MQSPEEIREKAKKVILQSDQPQIRRKVLIAGIDGTDNQFVRAVESYGIEAVHFGPNEGNGKQFPLDCDACICVTSFTSHKMFWAVKDHYRLSNKKVFIATHGFSEIKNDFEMFFISDLKKLLDGMKWSSRLYYLLSHFFRTPGTKFKLSEFEFKLQRFYTDVPHLGNFIQLAVDDGTIDRRERGKYVFKGLSEKRVLMFSKNYSTEIPTLWRRVEIVTVPQTEEVTMPATLIPEPVVALSSVPHPPTPLLEQKTSNEDVQLLLMTVSDLDKKVVNLSQQIQQLLSIFNPRALA